MAEEIAIHHHLKGLYITERSGEAYNVITQITKSKMNRVRLRTRYTAVLIGNANET